MSRFYSGIDRSRGPATRQGTEASGIASYVQGWGSRISAAMHVNRSTGKDAGGVRFGCGPSNYNGGALAIDFDNLDDVVNALALGDPKIERLRTRIYEAVKTLDAEASKAIERNEKAKHKAERRREREERTAAKRRQEILSILGGPEKLRLSQLLGVNWNADGNLEKGEGYLLKEANLRYSDPDNTHGFLGCILITARPKGCHQKYDFDLGVGQWVLPFDAADLGVAAALPDTGYGYRVEKSEAAA